MIIGTPLYTVEQIQNKVSQLAEQISRDYHGKEIVAISILKGSFIFFADLIRSIQSPVTVDFISSSSYLKTSSTGEVKIHCDIRENIEGKHVLLVDDIIDTGISLNYLRERFLNMNPASLKICILLDKKQRRVVDVPVDYIGFEIPDHFVVGYGLDYDDKYRNLPYIAIFKKEA
jgi:hypoxanthine phosphoribosyltransferase